ncbi:hypothetical protein B0T14DRAFT_264595 [Immersiella caudata]|uniref:Uncharacterized protein n=1 Tax=Immersiella caudata TaxID=314043 RepID=A0AA40BXE8_9PEZI|nr:hypothetical protein B0T14DRAFT_264595 [Immersiella caudata]
MRGGGRSRAEGLAEVSNAGPGRGRRVEVGLGLPRTRGVCVAMVRVGEGTGTRWPASAVEIPVDPGPVSAGGGVERGKGKSVEDCFRCLHSAPDSAHNVHLVHLGLRTAGQPGKWRAGRQVGSGRGSGTSGLRLRCGAGAERGGESGRMGMDGEWMGDGWGGEARAVEGGSLDGTKPRWPRVNGAAAVTAAAQASTVPRAVCSPTGPGCPGFSKQPFSCYAVPFRSPIELCRRPGATDDGTKRASPLTPSPAGRQTLVRWTCLPRMCDLHYGLKPIRLRGPPAKASALAGGCGVGRSRGYAAQLRENKDRVRGGCAARCVHRLSTRVPRLRWPCGPARHRTPSQSWMMTIRRRS